MIMTYIGCTQLIIRVPTYGNMRLHLSDFKDGRCRNWAHPPCWPREKPHSEAASLYVSLSLSLFLSLSIYIYIYIYIHTHHTNYIYIYIYTTI